MIIEISRFSASLRRISRMGCRLLSWVCDCSDLQMSVFQKLSCGKV